MVSSSLVMGCAPESEESWLGFGLVVEEGLSRRRTDADNAQTLVNEDGVVGDVVAAPIGAAVLDLLAHANGRGPELLHIGMPVREDGQRTESVPLKVGCRVLVASKNTTHVGGVVWVCSCEEDVNGAESGPRTKYTFQGSRRCSVSQSVANR